MSFLFYKVMLEDILPLNFFTPNMNETTKVLPRLYEQLFEMLDPASFQVIGQCASLYFSRLYQSLFFIANNEKIGFWVMDLLFMFGSGCQTGVLGEALRDCK